MSEEDVARWKKVRSAQRAAVTRATNQIDDLVKQPQIDVARLKQKKTVLLEKREIIRKLDEDILDAALDEDLDEEVKRSDEVQEQVEMAIIAIDEILSNKTSSLLENSVMSVPPTSGTSVIIPTSVVATSPVVPPIATTLTMPSWLTTPVTTAPAQPVSVVPSLQNISEAPPILSIPGIPVGRHTEGVTVPPGLIPMLPNLTELPSPVRRSFVPPAPYNMTIPPPIVSENASSVPSVRLPKLTLRKFNGDPTKWSTFWDLFEVSIHMNPALSKIKKFSYLLSLLESLALEAVSGLSLTSANYDEAVLILKTRFGNKHLIVNKHMEALMTLENIGSDNNVKGLRRLFDTVETQVRGLRGLGIPAESYGGLLSSLLISKLPPEMRLIVSRNLVDDSWELDKMLKVFERELMARERASANVSIAKGSGFNSRTIGGKMPPTAATFISQSTVSCAYCGKNHIPSSCTVLTSPEARKQSLLRSGRCFICLRRNHVCRRCRSTIKCLHCHGRHHSTICLRPSKPPNNDSTSSTATSMSTTTTSTTDSSPVMYVGGETQAALQTAMIVVHGVEQDCPTYKTKAILDCGSQRTYITSHVQQVLALPTLMVETIEIKPFGTKEGERRVCNVVDIGIVARDGQPLTVSALVVPCICDELEAPFVKGLQERYSHLGDLDLADVEGHSSVEVLIGADNYWSIVSGKIVRGVEGPVAIEFRLGWILSGPMEDTMVKQSFSSLLSTHSLRVDTLLSEDEKVNEHLKI